MAKGEILTEPDLTRIPSHWRSTILYWFHTGEYSSNFDEIHSHIDNCPYCSERLKQINRYERAQSKLQKQN